MFVHSKNLSRSINRRRKHRGSSRLRAPIELQAVADRIGDVLETRVSITAKQVQRSHQYRVRGRR